MIYLRLFLEFFKTGLFSVGGGLATLPFLYDMGSRTGWFSATDVADMLAVSESTPGGIGINMATYAGFKTAGVAGGIVATLGLAAPSVLIIVLISMILKRFRESRYVKSAFYGLRPASTALIAAAGISVLISVLFPKGILTCLKGVAGSFRYKELILMGVLFVLTNCVEKTKTKHPIVFIAFSAAAGILFGMG